jgi:hypothetical protein
MRCSDERRWKKIEKQFASPINFAVAVASASVATTDWLSTAQHQ